MLISTSIARGAEVLDAALDDFLVGETSTAIHRLFDGLGSLRDSMDRDDWKVFVTKNCRDHPIRGILMQDPLTRWACSKPRGYPGDAHLIDYIYGYAEPPDDTSDVGRAVFSYARETPAAKSVIARKDFVRQLAECVAARGTPPRILSLACGHLREAQECSAARDGGIAEWLGIDQDPESVGLVNREQGGSAVRACDGSVLSLSGNDRSLGEFDFIYATGLYDYLDALSATRLTTRMFDVLKPAGTFLVANFLPNIRELAYMESFMAWELICRTAPEMRALTQDLDPGQIASVRTYEDPQGNIVFLQVLKK